MALGNDRNIRYRQPKRAAALLAGDEAGNTAVHLVGKEPLRAHRDQAEHPLERVRNGNAVGKLKRPEFNRLPFYGERFPGHFSQHLPEVQVYRS